ncbi:hypothetical protein CRENBAI_004316 [Crenichthys baileyi]|uniref:Uncharacterized protein n=1 Tax=Crenichthys baileyi TaxID=28760 RepID=A0AAV9RGK7_9TELE
MPTWMLSLKRGSPNRVDYIWLVNACFLTNCLAAFPTEPSLDLLQTSTSEPCPPYLAITSSVKPELLQSEFKHLPARSSQCAVSSIVSPPSWRIKLHFLNERGREGGKCEGLWGSSEGTELRRRNSFTLRGRLK